MDIINRFLLFISKELSFIPLIPTLAIDPNNIIEIPPIIVLGLTLLEKQKWVKHQATH